MHARYLLFSVCIAASFAVACTGDDDQTRPSAMGGEGGDADHPAAAGKAGSTGATGGTSSAGQTAIGGEPGAAGAGGEAPVMGFTSFVHELVKNQTTETDSPASVNDRKFPDPTDDHGHYLVPATDFADLF